MAPAKSPSQIRSPTTRGFRVLGWELGRSCCLPKGARDVAFFVADCRVLNADRYSFHASPHSARRASL